MKSQNDRAKEAEEMSQILPQETLEKRRKRLYFRCWHRGTQELDLIFGPFADRYLSDLDEMQLDQLEALLQQPDPLVYQWLTGKIDPLPAFKNDLLEKLIRFVQDPKKP